MGEALRETVWVTGYLGAASCRALPNNSKCECLAGKDWEWDNVRASGMPVEGPCHPWSSAAGLWLSARGPRTKHANGELFQLGGGFCKSRGRLQQICICPLHSQRLLQNVCFASGVLHKRFCQYVKGLPYSRGSEAGPGIAWHQRSSNPGPLHACSTMPPY